MALNALLILTFVLFAFISSFLLFKNHIVYVGYDTQFHFRRIIEIKNSLLSNGNIMFSSSFSNFHGSGVMILYPYLNLLPYVILSLYIKSPINLIYIIFIFNSFMTFIISFYSCKNYSKSYTTAYMFSVVYGLLNVFIYYNLIGSDFGIVSTYMFLPLIIFGFLKIIQGEKNWTQLSIGMSLLLYSHILNLLIISSFLILYLIINLKNINKHIIIKFIKSIILFLFLTSIIWIPFLHLYLNNINNIHMPNASQLIRINIKDFISGLYGSKTNKSIGFFPIIAMFIGPLFYKKFNRYIKQLYLLSLMIVLGTIVLPWNFITGYNIFSVLNQLQYTARFLIIPQMTFSFIFALIISKYIKSFNKRFIIYFFTIFISIIMQMFIGQYVTTIKSFANNPSISDYLKETNNKNINMINTFGYKINNSSEFSLLINNYNIQDDDYIPKSALSISKYINNNLGFYNNKKLNIKHIGYNMYNFSNKSNKSNIQNISLPIYAYHKERLHVYLNDKLVNSYVNKNGLLTISNFQHYLKLNNKVHIQLSIDLFKIIGIILSIFGWLFILIKIIKDKINNEKRNIFDR